MHSTQRQIAVFLFLIAMLGSGTLPKSSTASDDRTSRIPIFLNWDYNCLVFPPEGIAGLVADAEQAGIAGLNIRMDNLGALNYRTRAGTCCNETLDAFGPDYDPLQIMIEQCRHRKIASCIWFDLFEGAYVKFLQEHPQFYPQGLPGKPHLTGFPCYAHREVREYMLAIVDELIGYRPDYVFFCTKSCHIPPSQAKEPHNHDSGFNPPVVKRYREQYGVNILNAPYDCDKLGRIRGEFVLDFLVAAKDRLNRAGIKTIVGATVSGQVQATGQNMVFDWRRVLERKAADVLTMSNMRREYWVFFDHEGQRKFREIVEACHGKGVQFWPYFIADGGTYDRIARDYGTDTLVEYLPRQMEYFRRLGGDAVLIHDLDLLARCDHGVRRCLWQAAGRQCEPSAERESGREITVPEPKPLAGRPSGGVPQGGFEDATLSCWYTASCWNNDPKTSDVCGAFEHGSRGQPRGWQADNGGNDRLFTAYDSEVLHDDLDSGRVYDGRSSVVVGARPGAGEQVNLTVQWTTDFPLPSIVLPGPQTIRVQTHGESLHGVAKAGMKVEVLDKKSHVLARLNAAAPTKGTYVWRPIEVSCTWPIEAARIKVSLYMTVDKTRQTAGRLWFDDFQIVSDEKPAQRSGVVLRHGAEAFAGQGYTELAAVPGVDMVSVPFHLSAAAGGKLRLALRSNPPMAVTVFCTHDRSRETLFRTSSRWDTYEFELADVTSPQNTAIVIRPHAAGTVWIDAVEHRIGVRAVVCDHRHGAAATWSHATDTADRRSFFYAEACAFRYNLAVTVFDSPFSPQSVSLPEKQAAAKTGRVSFQVYFQTDRWRDPRTSADDPAFPVIPDYYASQWSRAAVDAGFRVKVGQSKTPRYPNHGQQLFDISGGKYGYDVKNDRPGKVDVLSALIERHRQWIKDNFGYYPAAAAFRNGQTGAAYAFPKYFLGARNSIADGNVCYGRSTERCGFLGSDVPFELTPRQAAGISNTTRADDMNLPREEVLRHCGELLRKAIVQGGWYRDFIHWHTNPRFDTTLEEFFASQRRRMAGVDVVGLDFGEALQHKWLRDMTHLTYREDAGQIVLRILYRNPYDNLLLETLRIPMNVRVDLGGTSLAGRELASAEACAIRKLKADSFVVDVPYNRKQETVEVRLRAASGTPRYSNFSLPSVNSISLDQGALKITTDQPTRLALFATRRGGDLNRVELIGRSNSLGSRHVIDVRASLTTLKAADLYLGVITSQRQSILFGPTTLVQERSSQ